MESVNMECKQQEMKVDTDAGLVDALTVQIILSSSCLQRLMIAFSALIEVNRTDEDFVLIDSFQLFYGNKTVEEKHFIKQTDIIKLIDLIQVGFFCAYLMSNKILIKGKSNKIIE
jgi:hypothetical protein